MESPGILAHPRRRLDEVKGIAATLVFYESPHRLAGSLADCLDVLGDRPAAAVRELTKMHEETVRGSISGLVAHFSDASIKGEFVLVIDRRRAQAVQPAQVSLADRVAELQASGLDQKSALKAAAKEFGLSRSEAYRRLQSEK